MLWPATPVKNQRDFGFDLRGFLRGTTRTVSANPNYLYFAAFDDAGARGVG
jgi:hypothetical protein